ncbi:hypothetical protein NDN08_007620 [Rhodosorus marinus]|uniref:Peptidase S1 domain-containing protein n=1 Tax=Rhodosorus marinus TaxID=101924 RepID=A0AAV8UZL7_9RHOD|nr:hypothetical protein NDN08_007620 [Rhodosorus marinus]
MGLVVEICFWLTLLVVAAHGWELADPSWERVRLENGTHIPVESVDDGVRLSSSERVYKGADIKSIKEFPYLVGIFLRRGKQVGYVCTGTVVDRHVVLTAAHCFDDSVPNSQYEVCYASANLANKNLRKCTRVKTRKVQHNFAKQDATGPFDIALLRTKNPIRSPRTQIAKVDFRVSSTKGERDGHLIGFGVTESGPSASIWDGRLRYLPAKHRPMAQCSKYKDQKYFQCARSNRKNGKGGSCSGDSGSPLVEGPKKDPKKHRVIGVLSWAFRENNSKVSCTERGTAYAKLSQPEHKKFLLAAMKALGGKFKTA